MALRYGNESLRWITIQRDTQFHDGRKEWHAKWRCTSTSTGIRGVEAQEWNYIYFIYIGIRYLPDKDKAHN